jgi:hypothetical protein
MPRRIFVSHADLAKGAIRSFLSADAVVGAGTITLQDTRNFRNSQIILVGELGNDRSEIQVTDGTVAITDTLVTMQGTLAFAQSQDTPVYHIRWDLVQFTWGTTTVSADSAVQGTRVIDVTSPNKETYMDENTQTEGFYFTRFQDTVNVVNSSYSDPIPFGDYADNTVFKIKQRALDATNTEVDGKLITHQWLNETLWAARREVHSAPGKRPWRQVFESDLGNTALGQYRFEVPTNLEKPTTAENILGLRIGINDNLDYYPKREWDQDYEGSAHTTLSVGYTSGTGAITLADVRDFKNSGAINIEDDTADYTSKSNSSGTIILSTAFDVAHGTLTDVWQDISLGLPYKYTVFNMGGTNYVFFNQPIGTTYANLNIWGDYYRTLVVFDSDADVLDEPNPFIEAYVHYLKAHIIVKKDRTIELLKDSDYLEWNRKKQIGFDAEYTGQEVRLVPDY